MSRCRNRNRDCIRDDLNVMRGCLYQFFHGTHPILMEHLLKYADELDAAYRDIQISKIAGYAGCVTGGLLTVVGAGLSFVTFGVSVGLCIAGGVIGGAGGVTAGGASIAEFIKSKEVREKADVQLKVYDAALGKLLERCKLDSYRSGGIGNLPCWCEFWERLLFGSVGVIAGGWEMVTEVIKNAVEFKKHKINITAAACRALGKTAKIFFIVGGIVSAVFIPLDIYSLVSNAKGVHNKDAHETSKKIRKVVLQKQSTCPSEIDIDLFIDECIESY